jgi:hypothetical protein
MKGATDTPKATLPVITQSQPVQFPEVGSAVGTVAAFVSRNRHVLSVLGPLVDEITYLGVTISNCRCEIMGWCKLRARNFSACVASSQFLPPTGPLSSLLLLIRGCVTLNVDLQQVSECLSGSFYCVHASLCFCFARFSYVWISECCLKARCSLQGDPYMCNHLGSTH